MTLVEITDNSTSRMMKSRITSGVVNSVFPSPIRFKRVWHLARGDKSLFAWRAVPPDGFLALGMICTTTGQFIFADV